MSINTENSLGLEKGVVRLAAYDTGWAAMFEAEAAVLREAAGDKIGRIAHHGSTAIPGMTAKPILDLMAEVESEPAGIALAGVLEAAGYEFHPDEDVPGRLFFTKDAPDGRTTHHLSLTETNSDFWRKQIAFRDYLRTDAQARNDYLKLKHTLASQYPADRPTYVDSKTVFVERILALAGE